ncbi:MAG: hypothetical protein Kow0069_35870 [Promethearchaeota archaeon]
MQSYTVGEFLKVARKRGRVARGTPLWGALVTKVVLEQLGAASSAETSVQAPGLKFVATEVDWSVGRREDVVGALGRAFREFAPVRANARGGARPPDVVVLFASPSLMRRLGGRRPAVAPSGLFFEPARNSPVSWICDRLFDARGVPRRFGDPGYLDPLERAVAHELGHDACEHLRGEGRRALERLERDWRQRAA